MHVVSSREQDWTEQEVAVESSPTIIYQEVSGGESQSATSTIKALLELQQTTGEPLCHGKAADVDRRGRGGWKDVNRRWGIITCKHADISSAARSSKIFLL